MHVAPKVQWHRQSGIPRGRKKIRMREFLFLPPKDHHGSETIKFGHINTGAYRAPALHQKIAIKIGSNPKPAKNGLIS